MEPRSVQPGVDTLRLIPLGFVDEGGQVGEGSRLRAYHHVETRTDSWLNFSTGGGWKHLSVSVHPLAREETRNQFQKVYLTHTCMTRIEKDFMCYSQLQ